MGIYMLVPWKINSPHKIPQSSALRPTSRDLLASLEDAAQKNVNFFGFRKKYQKVAVFRPFFLFWYFWSFRNLVFTRLRVVVCLPLFTKFFFHPRWLFGISSINRRYVIIFTNGKNTVATLNHEKSPPNHLCEPPIEMRWSSWHQWLVISFHHDLPLCRCLRPKLFIKVRGLNEPHLICFRYAMGTHDNLSYI